MAEGAPTRDVGSKLAPGTAALTGQRVPQPGQLGHSPPHTPLGRSAGLFGRDKLFLIRAKAIPAGDDFASFAPLWHILESHGAILWLGVEFAKSATRAGPQAQPKVRLATDGARLAAINVWAAPKGNEPPPVTVNDTATPPGDLGALGFHGASLRGKAVAKLSPGIPQPVPSTGRDGGMTPAATAAQSRVRWGALGCRIRRGSSAEEAEPREETGALGNFRNGLERKLEYGLSNGCHIVLK